jgi:hypothetical protein
MKDTFDTAPRKKRWDIQLWWGIGFGIGWADGDFTLILPFVAFIRF